MALTDRELQNILSSGELNNIQLGGTEVTKKVVIKSELDTTNTNVSTNATNIANNTTNITNNANDITALDTRVTAVESPTVTPYQDQLGVAPAYTAGNLYFSNGDLNLQTGVGNTTLQIGKEQYIEVVNNTGATITNGSLVRQDGVAGGQVQIALALADTFVNARIFGVATHDIPSGGNGIVTTFGIVHDIDTSTLAVGVPLYLSDTVAGTMTANPPDIASSVGGVLLADAINGKLFVKIQNTINLPETQGYLQGQNLPTYNLTNGVATPIIDYATSGNIVMGISPGAGTITPGLAGIYGFNFTFSGTTNLERQSIDIELFDYDTSTVLYTHTLPTGRDLDGGKIATSFQVPGNIVNTTANLVIRFKPDADMQVIINQCNFSASSLHIR